MRGRKQGGCLMRLVTNCSQLKTILLELNAIILMDVSNSSELHTNCKSARVRVSNRIAKNKQIRLIAN